MRGALNAAGPCGCCRGVRATNARPAEDGTVEVASFEGLYRSEWGRLVALAAFSSGSRDGAEDIAQEAFARLAERWDKISGYDRPDRWLRLVTIRLAQRSRRRPSAPLDDTGPDTAVGDVGAQAAMTADVLAAMATLSRRERAVMALSVTYGLEAAGIASVLRITPTTVRVTLHNARRKLGVALAVEDQP